MGAMVIFQHWFRQWLGTIQVPSQYLNQCWLMDGWCGWLDGWMDGWMDLSSKLFSVIHLWAILQEVLINLISEKCSEIIVLDLLPHIPVFNELSPMFSRQKHLMARAGMPQDGRGIPSDPMWFTRYKTRNPTLAARVADNKADLFTHSRKLMSQRELNAISLHWFNHTPWIPMIKFSKYNSWDSK